MKSLIVVATGTEINPLLENAKKERHNLYRLNKNTSLLITGAGIVPTVFSLTKFLSEINQWDLLINAGIAGSFSPQFNISATVEITEDTFADWGIDNNGTFIPVWKLPHLQNKDFPFENGWLKNPKPFDKTLEKTKGITVNKTSGSTSLINDRKRLYNPGVETMESAAFFWVALQFRLPFAAIRTSSNIVEPRNTKNWNTALAIKNLNNYLMDKIL